MSRKARSLAPSEPSVVSQPVFDKSYMVCVRSADGHCFLVDRNCAMVSGVLRNAMQKTTFDTDDDVASNNVALSPDSGELTVIGSEAYETLTVEEIGAEMMDLAFQAMYFKYRYDNESEKRQLEVQNFAENRHKLAALSVLLDM